MSNRFLIIIVVLLLSSCYKSSDYILTPQDYSKYLTVQAPDSIPADGVSTCTITVTILATAKSLKNRRNILFRTTAGIFQASNLNTLTVLANEQPINSKDTTKLVATAVLQSINKLDTAIITVDAFDSIEQIVTVKFYTIPPIMLNLQSSMISFKALQEDSLKAILITNNIGGLGTQGQIVDFKASFANTGDIILDTRKGLGYFRSLDSLSNYKGMSFVVFTTISPTNPLDSGKVNIEAYMQNNPALNSSSSVYFTK